MRNLKEDQPSLRISSLRINWTIPPARARIEKAGRSLTHWNPCSHRDPHHPNCVFTYTATLHWTALQRLFLACWSGLFLDALSGACVNRPILICIRSWPSLRRPGQIAATHGLTTESPSMATAPPQAMEPRIEADPDVNEKRPLSERVWELTEDRTSSKMAPTLRLETTRMLRSILPVASASIDEDL